MAVKIVISNSNGLFEELEYKPEWRDNAGTPVTISKDLVGIVASAIEEDLD